MEDTRILDDALASFTSLDASSFTETLRLLLGAEPGVVVISPTDPRADSLRTKNVFHLASKLHKFQSLVIWTGELNLPEGKTVRVGPVTVIDEKGLRSTALGDISTTLKSYLSTTRDDSVGQIRLVVDCATQADTGALPLKDDLRLGLTSPFANFPRISYTPAAGARCPLPSDLTTAIVTSRTELKGSQLRLNVFLRLEKSKAGWG
ncbi:hypothetical protein QA640_04665 [Bradyrhizobium sp. CB82]|uniref:hypothetical protein n=1 Tax=Bradyrhizobium sp. CB82 TaxID=3039159 RepID=UPI0024B1FC3A|nr:hypothetical protein [Bradyrhizobium sp. CB82]WFU41805.1 hypothetical protein QA640_04665 [Bradyrhizobium sp. CB82]